jgi:hypothetical protein
LVAVEQPAIVPMTMPAARYCVKLFIFGAIVAAQRRRAKVDT